jgi:hypothetical protein
MEEPAPAFKPERGGASDTTVRECVEKRDGLDLDYLHEHAFWTNKYSENRGDWWQMVTDDTVRTVSGDGLEAYGVVIVGAGFSGIVRPSGPYCSEQPIQIRAGATTR